MSFEVAYDDDFVRLELALGYELHDRLRQDGEATTAVLTGAQRFTALSVLGGVERALAADRGTAKRQGEAFDRAHWWPSDAAVETIQKEHRLHRRYLRGIAGLWAYAEGIRDGVLTFDEPHYDYQLEAIIDAATYLQNNDPFGGSSKGGYVEISGGGGKSRIVADIVAGFKSLEDPDDPNRVLVISPDIEVQSELAGKDGRSGMGKYAPQLNPGLVNAGSKEWESEVVVATRDMVRRALQEDPRALERYDLILGDEAHKLLGDVTLDLLQQVRRQMLGLTGSAKFTDKKQVSLLMPEKLTARETHDLLMDGKIAPMQFWICKTGQVTYQEAGRLDYTDAEIRRISRMPERHKLALDAARAFFRDNRNGVISCNTVEEAKVMAEAASGYVIMPDGRRRRVKVVPVLGELDDNHKTFKDLADNKIQGVTIVNIETGWNVPLASFLVNLAPTASWVRAAQRAWRLNRLAYDADGKVITSQFLDLVDTVRRRSRGDPQLAAPTRQIVVPELLGEKVYLAAQVLASPATEGRRRDFSLNQFPPHLRRAISMADGVPVRKLASFGAGVLREEPPDGYITLLQAASGLGVTLSRLHVAMAVQAVRVKDKRFIGEEAVGKVEEHLLRIDEPIL